MTDRAAGRAGPARRGAVALMLAWLAVPSGSPVAAESLVRPLAGAEVDWTTGTVRARAGAAADPRLPTPDMARPGAERRARSRALERLRGALAKIPLGAGRVPTAAAIEAAVGAARVRGVEYQSNGGAFVSVEVGFEVLGDAPGANATGAVDAGPGVGVTALSVSAAPLDAAPLVACGDREVALRAAHYRMQPAPADASVIAVKQSRRGRLQLPERSCAELDGFAGRVAVIYLQKVSR